MDESQHLNELYTQLTTDVTELTQKLADLQFEGRAVKQQLAAEGHLDLGSMTETLDTFASIEANNRQIDTLNSRYDAAVVRLSHAKLLVPQAYFAKLTLDYGDGPEAFYLGKVGYADTDTNDLVYDWRAPMADAYYANRTGATTYTANGRDIAVQVVGRTQLVIDHDHLIHAIDSQTAVGDPLLLAVLAQDRTGELQEITATIQHEQNAIIRESTHPVVIVAGVAGSGKTSVMLQRVAYQLFQHRGEWAADQILIITPNAAFGQYIKGVLPALGEAEAMTVTYPRLLNQLASRFGVEAIDPEVEQLAAIDAVLNERGSTFIGNVGQLAWQQSDDTQSFLSRMQRVWRWLKAMDQIPDDLSQWLNFEAFAQAFALPPMSHFDQLYLLLRITAYQQSELKSVFIDEAQDYPDAMWRVIRNIFAKSELTIVGDPSQKLSGAPVTIADYFLDRRTALMQLTTSYRATGAITETFAQYAGDLWAGKIQAVQATGETPQTIDASQLTEALTGFHATATQSIAIITPDAESAEQLAQHIDGQLLTTDSQKTVSAGLNILPVGLAKGLEFDFVVVWDWENAYYQDPEFGDQRRYVATSRGTKQLVLVTGDKLD
ncbi:UvrD-helicase domain-containing protein [Lacticaseibacillus porcinae]|uniref:UvrD-helicase domain-containing protein n=1 Tax=Lacticaseibacillus porcinae TaxID=1123687 RepID=UPI0013DE5224|nr:UvrD-helicase domain-containing protein [Lacticaseibacillus porcinae]